MRTLLILLALVTALSSCQSDQTPDPVTAPDGTVLNDPAQYNDYFIQWQDHIIEHMGNLAGTFESFDSASIEANYLELGKAINRAKYHVEGLPPYDSDTLLKPAVVGLFSFYDSLYADEYRQITHVLQKGPDGINDDDLFLIDSLTLGIDNREKIHDKNFSNAQRIFADRYGMMILD